MNNIKGIAVYCASSDNIAPVYFEAARALGAEIARHGLPVVNGGGKMGLMAAVSDGALDAGGQAIGVIPQFMVDAGRNHPASRKRSSPRACATAKPPWLRSRWAS